MPGARWYINNIKTLLKNNIFLEFSGINPYLTWHISFQSPAKFGALNLPGRDAFDIEEYKSYVDVFAVLAIE